MRRLRTIGFRLTLWGAGATLLVSLIVCSILYVGVRYSLYRQVDTFLEDEIHEFMGLVREYSSNPGAAQEAIRSHLANRTREDLRFRVVEQTGQVIISSDPADPLATLPLTNASPPDSGFFETITPRTNQPLRVCSLPVRQPDGRLLITQASFLLDRVNASLSLVLRAAIVSLLAGIVLAIGVARILAKRGLLPLYRMTSTAEHISTSRLSERLPRTGSGDELDRLASVLNDLLDRVQQYVGRMQQFTADASHELRSPLAALRGNVEVALSRKRTPEELRKVLEENAEQYDRLIRITEDLLLLARIDSGEVVFRRESLQLEQSIEDAVDLFAPVAAERGLRLQLIAEPGLSVIGDPGRLRQLMGNLIENAIKYTPAPGTIDVVLQRRNGSVRLQVTDTGVGISSEDLPRVFDRFYRVDRSRANAQTNGVGLGLAICRSIVKGHGGEIVASSVLGEGTTMTVDLPLADLP